MGESVGESGFVCVLVCVILTYVSEVGGGRSKGVLYALDSQSVESLLPPKDCTK